jgi:ssDNA-binding Zn-finger/Zn-ribbon topoisomerase 1
LEKNMGRPRKEKPTCDTCGRVFARQNNLDWHAATHASGTGPAPVITDHAAVTGPAPPITEPEEVEQMAESCPNCHTLEHKLEKQDSEIERMADDLRSAATALRQPAPKAEGHTDFQGLLDCPSCGPPALTSFEGAGGAVLPPGRVKPALVNYVKEHFPIFGAEVEVANLDH